MHQLCCLLVACIAGTSVFAQESNWPAYGNDPTLFPYTTLFRS